MKVSEGEFDTYTGSMQSADTDGYGRVSGDEVDNFQTPHDGSAGGAREEPYTSTLSLNPLLLTTFCGYLYC